MKLLLKDEFYEGIRLLVHRCCGLANKVLLFTSQST